MLFFSFDNSWKIVSWLSMHYKSISAMIFYHTVCTNCKKISTNTVKASEIIYEIHKAKMINYLNILLALLPAFNLQKVNDWPAHFVTHHPMLNEGG